MTILALLVFLLVWLTIYWTGSVLLEATGLERSKARFQALSALAGTGFSAQESELAVNQPRRRRIASWLIILNCFSILVLVVLAVMFARYGFHAPVWQIGFFSGVIIILVVLIKLGCFDRLASRVIASFQQREQSPYSLAGGILHEKNNYGVVRVWLSTQAKAINMTIRDTGFDRSGITVLAIERRGSVITFPDSSQFLQPGDYILCYGNISNITEAAMRRQR